MSISVATARFHSSPIIRTCWSCRRCRSRALWPGCALGGVGLIEALHRVKNSFNSYPLSSLAQAGATASVHDDAYFHESCARVVAVREAMTRELIRLGFIVLPSSANFVFARHPAQGGAEFAAALREHAVLVRQFNKPRTAPYLRITVGTENDVRRLIAAAVLILGHE